MILDKKYKITVCADGFVSIMENAKDRRLGAALPAYSCSDIHTAMELIRRVCVLTRCDHGKKTGVIIEPKAPNFIGREGSQDISMIQQFGELLQKAEEDLKRER